MKSLEESIMLGGGLDKFYEEIIRTNFDDRKIVLNQNVDASLLEDAVLWILKWNKEDKGKPIEERKKIFIYTNSLGGDVLQD